MRVFFSSFSFHHFQCHHMLNRKVNIRSGSLSLSPEMKDVKDTHQLYNTMNTNSNHCHIPQKHSYHCISIVCAPHAFHILFHCFPLYLDLYHSLSLYYSGPIHSSVSFSIEQTIFAIQSAKTKYFHIVCVCVDASAICHFGSLSTF